MCTLVSFWQDHRIFRNCLKFCLSDPLCGKYFFKSEQECEFDEALTDASWVSSKLVLGQTASTYFEISNFSSNCTYFRQVIPHGLDNMHQSPPDDFMPWWSCRFCDICRVREGRQHWVQDWPMGTGVVPDEPTITVLWDMSTSCASPVGHWFNLVNYLLYLLTLYRCNGQQSCEVAPGNNLVGFDPCPNIFKYLKMTYSCVPDI